MAKTHHQTQHYTDGASTPKKVSPATFQSPAPTVQLPNSSADEPATSQAAAAQQHAGLHATPGTPMVSPAAVAHAEATATAIARARLRAGASPRAALADAAAASTMPVFDQHFAAGTGAAAHAAHITHAPFPAAARFVERGAAAAGRAAGRLSKYASTTGLEGVAEAAGHVVGELAPATKWRQEVLLTRLAAGATLAITLGYVLLFAPSSLGWRAEMRLVRSFGYDNAVAFALINLLGFFPAILGCVAWPLLRGARHQPPLWRYILASTMTGAFALLSYLAAWDPPKPGRAPRMPPQHLAGRTRGLQRAYESRLFPATLLASSCAMIALAFNSSAATWAQFGYLASHSFTFHVMLLDFSLLTILSTWLVSKDAAARGWPIASTAAGRRFLQAAMLVTPVVGPGVYLMIRPVSREGGVLRRGWLRRGAAAAWAAVKYPFHLPVGGISGRSGAGRFAGAARRAGGVGTSAAAAAGRPAHSTNTRRQYAARVANGGAAAHRSDIAAAVAHAAEVPLPAAGAAGAAVGAVQGLVQLAWSGGWSWLGQRVARLRGGGAPVDSGDEAAGVELDAMDDTAPRGHHDEPHNPQVQVYRTSEGTDTTTGDTTDLAAAAAPATPNNAYVGGVSHRLAKLGGLLLPHVQQQGGRRWLPGWELGPSAAPAKGKDDEAGTDMLLFSDEYDEYEYDFEASSSDEGDEEEEGFELDESAGWLGGEEEEEEEEAGFKEGGFGGAEEGGDLVAALWRQQQERLHDGDDDEADDMDIDE